ncbi:unnamed protein product, partial [Ectocarpus sp. 12 AP-2014]
VEQSIIFEDKFQSFRSHVSVSLNCPPKIGTNTNTNAHSFLIGPHAIPRRCLPRRLVPLDFCAVSHRFISTFGTNTKTQTEKPCTSLSGQKNSCFIRPLPYALVWHNPKKRATAAFACIGGRKRALRRCQTPVWLLLTTARRRTPQGVSPWQVTSIPNLLTTFDQHTKYSGRRRSSKTKPHPSPPPSPSTLVRILPPEQSRYALLLQRTSTW